MNSQSRMFDFDEWKNLFETNPDAFETRRQELIDAAIQRASSKMQHRLRGLQWRIDITRRRYKHPMVSSAKLFEMMWHKVYGNNGLLEVLTAPELVIARSNAPCTNLIGLRPQNDKQPESAR